MQKLKSTTICLLFFYLGGVTDAAAQVKYSKSQKALKKEADFYFSYGDYVRAQNVYDSLYQFDSSSPELNFRLGICVLVTNDDKSKSTEYFKTASDRGHVEAHFYLGNWYHLQNDFDKSIELYQKYKNADEKKSIEESEINKRINTSNRAREMMNNPVDVRIENLGTLINTEYPEYVPVISADESVLIYTSRRKESTGGKLDPYGRYFEDIYISHKENDVWLPPVAIDTNINTDTHDACVGLSSDGYTLITYRANESLTGGDLYWSTLDGDVWIKPIKYGPNINSEYIEPSASLASNRNTLYFSSNRPGGYGGLDIYRVVRLPDKEWSFPVNLGSAINTKYDDDAPFIHPDNVTLYFSSQGHTTMGGYDIFKSVLGEDGAWSKPENLGYPINTTDNDIYFVLSADGKRGYYSSSQMSGYGKQDIYIMHLPYEFKELTIIKGAVTSADSLAKPLKARIVLRDYKTKKIIELYHSNSKTGKYMLVIQPDRKVRISVEVTGYWTSYDVLYFKAGEGFSTIYRPIRLETQD
ncbi:MAG: PD40 domain-containing protein [Flavobacteriales bacterium]|nr:PD40 domain-containing protein [Flavobacteriales bacterium]